jgi:lipopolysaccharide/colanic/teichoic acid biosynthesis glycosyltransferase
MYALIKRLLDILLSLIVLTILLPLFIPIIVLLSLTDEREIFYTQKRIGLHNKHFNILKFATMLKNSPNMGTGSITLRNDPRVTTIGKYLRITKINELPQIVNVLRGDMSLVGPRPLVDKTFAAYSEDVRKIIYNVKPGITGIGSIIFRDEEKLISEAQLPPYEFYSKVIAPYKGELEMWYHNHFSLWTDFKLLFLTIWVILFHTSNLPYKILKGLPKRTF